MISTFEKNDLDLSGIKEELKDLFVLARNEKEDLFERNRNNDLIHTDFYMFAHLVQKHLSKVK